MIEKMKEVIEKEINPYLAMHSGGAELVDVDDGIVTLQAFRRVVPVAPPLK